MFIFWRSQFYLKPNDLVRSVIWCGDLGVRSSNHAATDLTRALWLAVFKPTWFKPWLQGYMPVVNVKAAGTRLTKNIWKAYPFRASVAFLWLPTTVRRCTHLWLACVCICALAGAHGQACKLARTQTGVQLAYTNRRATWPAHTDRRAIWHARGQACNLACAHKQACNLACAHRQACNLACAHRQACGLACICKHQCMHVHVHHGAHRSFCKDNDCMAPWVLYDLSEYICVESVHTCASLITHILWSIFNTQSWEVTQIAPPADA